MTSTEITSQPTDAERFGHILAIQRAAYLRDGAPSLAARRSDLRRFKTARRTRPGHLRRRGHAGRHMARVGAPRRRRPLPIDRTIERVDASGARHRHGRADQAGRRASRVASLPAGMGSARLLPRTRIVLQAFAALGHSLNPRVLDDPSITAAARHLCITPAQVVLSWAAQRGSAFLTTSTKPEHTRENFGIVPLPEDVMVAIRDRISTNVRFNAVLQTGVPGFIPRADEA
jgi:hypothetical protein